MFVLKRTDQGGGYVSKDGHKFSYTPILQNAKKFKSIENANKERCIENEIILDLERILDEVRY